MKCRWCDAPWEPETSGCAARAPNHDHEWEREVFVEPVVSLGPFEPNRELARRLAAEIAADFASVKARAGDTAGRGDGAGPGMSEKRLYKVRAVHEYVALSDSPHEARRFARDAARDSEPATSAELMVKPDGTTTYPAGWDAKCLVYGSKTDLTLGAALKAERRRLQALAPLDGGVTIPSAKPATNNEPEPTLAEHMAAIRRMDARPDVTSEEIAERMFDALCCGARARDVLDIAADRALVEKLIDLLFAKLSDARAADAIEAAGDEPETPTRLNINTQVWVRLTMIGAEVAARTGFTVYDHALKRARGAEPGEWCCDTIWRLMHYFGAVCYMGAPLVFVDNEFVLTDPTTKATSDPEPKVAVPRHHPLNRRQIVVPSAPGETALGVWHNGYEWVVATSAEDARDVACASSGERPEDYDADDWERCADDSTVTIRGDNGAPSETRTCAEWVTTHGRGFLCTTEA